jgi:fumarylacetoacetate (FAA) hydrolase
MKLATLRDGSRDGQLMVVARDLKTAQLADGIAPTLQAALDDWAFIAPQLATLATQLDAGRAARSFDFNPSQCMAPLPRAYQWVDACAYLNHFELAWRARGEDLPVSLREEPLMVQGASDRFLGARDDIVLAHEEWGVDFEAKVAVVTGDVPLGATPDQALAQVRLVMLVNDVSLRNLIAAEATGYSAVQAKPATVFAPVAVTPDELGDAWKQAKLHLPLRSTWNGALVGQPQAGDDMAFNFAQLVAHLCRTRPASAGTIVGAGPVSNKKAKSGYSCIAEQRWQETVATGAPVTGFMRFGDTIRIEMIDKAGKSVFGAIEQTFKQPARAGF